MEPPVASVICLSSVYWGLEPVSFRPSPPDSRVVIHVWDIDPHTRIEVWIFCYALGGDAANIGDDALRHLREIISGHGTAPYAPPAVSVKAVIDTC